jgi:hypothetical protein
VTELLAEARTTKTAVIYWPACYGHRYYPARRVRDANDADRLCRDPAMRWGVGDQAITGFAVSASQIDRFETEWLTRPKNLIALADLPGRWIDKVHERSPPRWDDRRTRCAGNTRARRCPRRPSRVPDKQPSREVDQDRRQGCQPWLLRPVPNGGGRRAAADVQGYPDAHRSLRARPAQHERGFG